MEAARLGLSEYHAVSSLSRAAGSTLALPMDPWLSPPLLSALPGFLSHPQTGYPSYLTSPIATDPSRPPPVAHSHSPTTTPDLRTTSIAALRMKAKEHVENITKGLQMVQVCSSDNHFVYICVASFVSCKYQCVYFVSIIVYIYYRIVVGLFVIECYIQCFHQTLLCDFITAIKISNLIFLTHL